VAAQPAVTGDEPGDGATLRDALRRPRPLRPSITLLPVLDVLCEARDVHHAWRDFGAGSLGGDLLRIDTCAGKPVLGYHAWLHRRVARSEVGICATLAVRETDPAVLWERLSVRGAIPPGFVDDPRRSFLPPRGSVGWLLGALGPHGARPSTVEDVVSFASDPGGMQRAETLVVDAGRAFGVPIDTFHWVCGERGRLGARAFGMWRDLERTVLAHHPATNLADRVRAGLAATSAALEGVRPERPAAGPPSVPVDLRLLGVSMLAARVAVEAGRVVARWLSDAGAGPPAPPLDPLSAACDGAPSVTDLLASATRAAGGEAPPGSRAQSMAPTFAAFVFNQQLRAEGRASEPPDALAELAELGYVLVEVIPARRAAVLWRPTLFETTYPYAKPLRPPPRARR